MTTDQKTVAIGAGSGVLSMLLLIWGLYAILPTVEGVETVVEQMIFALKWNVVAVLPLFVMIANVGNGRFLSEAINPLRHAEDKTMEIDGRVVDNTFQQNFVFFVGTMALSTVLTPESLKIIMALTIVFVLARTVFWIGYRMNPLYRAPGMAATAYMNLGILLFVLQATFFLM